MIVVKNPQKLRDDITKSGNTITSAGEYVGYSKAYVSSIISGTRSPNPDIAIKLCELTGEQFNKYFFIVPVNKKITK